MPMVSVVVYGAYVFLWWSKVPIVSMMPMVSVVV